LWIDVIAHKVDTGFSHATKDRRIVNPSPTEGHTEQVSDQQGSTKLLMPSVKTTTEDSLCARMPTVFAEFGWVQINFPSIGK
jgi:hypothetical protein